MKLAFVLLITLLALGCGNYKAPAGAMGTTALANISALVPSSATNGGSGFTLTVNGTSFAANSVVFFGGTAEATTFVTASQLMATIPASAIANAGAKSVYVNSAGNIYGVNSNMVNFMVN